MVSFFNPNFADKLRKGPKKNQELYTEKRTCREHVLEYWCDPGCFVDHALAKVVNKELESWGTDLLEELFCFLGYMDPRSLTEQEVDYLMFHHGFLHPLRCDGKQLYSLNCDDMVNLGYGGLTGGYDRLRLCDFLLTILGKEFYPWTLKYPRPGGKVRCCYDFAYGAFYCLKMLISVLVMFAMACAMFVFLIPLRCLSFMCPFCGRLREPDEDCFWTPTLFCTWLAASLWVLFAYLFDEIYWLYAAAAAFGPFIIFYSFIIIVEILQTFGIAQWIPNGIQCFEEVEEWRLCEVLLVPCVCLTFLCGIVCIILSQTAFDDDNENLFVVIGVTSFTTFWILVVCGFSYVSATACFHPDVTFERVDGQHVTAEQLRPGDHILSADGTWTKVLLTVLHDKKGEKSVFYRFHLDNGNTIAMTDKHYQPIWKSGRWVDVPAEEVRVGDLLSLRSKVLKGIVRIETFKSHGNNIICRNPYIIANGIRASWDIKCTFPHIATNVIRALLPILHPDLDFIWQALSDMYIGKSLKLE